MEIYNWLVTTEDKWFNKWDELQRNSSNGNFTQLTTWMKAYSSYGFRFELLLAIDQNENIIIGSGNIIVKLPLFKFYICSYGPWGKGNANLYEQFIEFFIKRAKELGVVAAQITVPTDANINDKFHIKKFCERDFFSKITSPVNVNIIELLPNKGGMLDEEQVISSFKTNGRRDVRAAYRKGLESRIANTHEDLERAYHCFIDNSQNKGYFVRDWQDMKDSLFEAIDKGDALMLTAWYEEEIQGAILLYKGGNTINYTLGGVYRHQPDLLTGYFLQLEAMKIACKMGVQKYNITSGGPVEVKNFKMKFNPTFHQIGTTFSYPNKKWKCVLFQFIYQRFKCFIPEILKLLKLIRI